MSSRRRYATKEELEAQGYYSRPALRERRLKPLPGAAYREYWQGRGTVRAYLRADCVPMREYRPATPEQAAALAAGRELVGTACCKVCGERHANEELKRGKCQQCIREGHVETIVEEITHWLTLGPLFIDTETTGLDSDDQIVEIAVLDADGEQLYHSLVKPSVPVSEGAAYVHGITDAELATAPNWPEIDSDVRQLIAGRMLIAHNSSFDDRMLAQTCRAYGLKAIDADWRCTMHLLTQINGGRWPRLGVALQIAGVAPPDGDSHRALHDAECVRRIVLNGFNPHA